MAIRRWVLGIRVSREERDRAHAIAAERGTTVARMVRDTFLLPYAKMGRPPEAERKQAE